MKSCAKQFTVNIAAPSSCITNSPPNGTAGVPYSFQFTSAFGTGPRTFQFWSGSLPSGLSLDASGLLSGYPCDSGDSLFEVAVFDADANMCSQFFTVTMAAGAQPDWSGMVWADGTEQNSDGLAVLTRSAAGDSGTAKATHPVGTFYANFTGKDGSMTWVGPRSNCNIRVVQSLNKGQNTGVVVIVDGSFVVSFFPTGPGTTDIPFDVPCSQGGISIQVSFTAGDATGVTPKSTNTDISITLSNL